MLGLCRLSAEWDSPKAAAMARVQLSRDSRPVAVVKWNEESLRTSCWYSSSLRVPSHRGPHRVSRLAKVSAETPPSRVALLRSSNYGVFKAPLGLNSQCGERFKSGRERHWSSADRNTRVLSLLQYCTSTRLLFSSRLPARMFPKPYPPFSGSMSTNSFVGGKR